MTTFHSKPSASPVPTANFPIFSQVIPSHKHPPQQRRWAFHLDLFMFEYTGGNCPHVPRVFCATSSVEFSSVRGVVWATLSKFVLNKLASKTEQKFT